ncbi:PREDICTED: uncharacterized protein LOC104727821 [Camelina sativa]|uniref:Uncharacterized protein LOC104727821 n=1 Tax=Camelina sativa TaxID=90675 RepID=A0ABM0URU6_CAMSA|nr:PREDICTED: uncharacterized protein LOC104727821 [Camelina sativa]
MASSSTSDSTTVPETTNLQRKSNDVGWEFGMLVNPKNLDKMKCKLCGKEFSGGIHRLKQHVARIQGNVAPCPKSKKEDQEKCKLAILEAKNKKKRVRMADLETRKTVNIDENQEGDEEVIEVEGMGANKSARMLGPIDRFTSSINPETPKGPILTQQQQHIKNVIAKDRLHVVHQYVARWVYSHGIPFNAIANDDFKRMLEAAGQFGPGVTPPSQYQLREPLLKEEVDRVKGLMKEQEDEWKVNGCSIMTDSWSDRKRRSIMNLCINCKEGAMFLSSKDCSDDSHTGEYIFAYVNECIEKLGGDHVVQVVTDNATNNMAAAKLLKEVRPTIFWTSCATHTINLMVEGISKLPVFEETIKMAKAFTIFIYAHHQTLSMMRKFTKRKDIVRPGVTRFASAFLTLQSLVEKEESLKMMFASHQWKQCKWAKHAKGLAARNTTTSMEFWDGMEMCLKVFAPLVRVLRLVDGDQKPTMGFLHGELKEAKKEICKALGNLEKNYRPVLNIIDQKGKDRLDSPLHWVAYFLNPYYFYKDSSIQFDRDVVTATFKCVDAFFPNDLNTQTFVINTELSMYTRKEGNFGHPTAIKGCSKNDENFDPVQWWNFYGVEVPKLQTMAKKILSLTTSSSGCERNWSTFEGVHTKKRNKLETKRLNNLVYVQFNMRLLAKRKKQKDKNMDILVANTAVHAQDWIVEDAYVELGDTTTHEDLVRELDESDEGEEVDIDFESDDEHGF